MNKTMTVTLLVVGALLPLLAQAPRPAQSSADHEPIRLTARTLRHYDVPDADQGVAADKTHFYAVDNAVIAKHEIASGKLVTRWSGVAQGLIRHMNSCLVETGRILCANSNYPSVPMGSSIEIFEAATLTHAETHSLGLMDEGSITWFDRYRGGWLAGFAHYSGNGGLPFKDHTYSSVVTFNADWRRTGGWLFPQAVVARMAPDAASGGAIGPDGLLYILGHDRPEMYVLGRPPMGPVMVHVATIDVEAEGQAFSWAQDGSRRVFAIERRRHMVRLIEIPPIPPAAVAALPFR